MQTPKDLIVEDDGIISQDAETATTCAGFHVCAIASSEVEALELAELHRPELAVVDISLSPGDGRVVAKAVCQIGTGVLFATGRCNEVRGLHETRASGCGNPDHRTLEFLERSSPGAA